MKRGVSTVWGVVLIVFGVALLLGRLGGFHLSAPWKLWPLFVVAIGAGEMAERRPGAGAALMLVGGGLLAASLGLQGISFGVVWPFLIVAGGLGIVVDALASGRPRRDQAAAPERARAGRRRSLFAWAAALFALATAWAWMIAFTAISAAGTDGVRPALLTVTRALRRVVTVLAPHARPLLPVVAMAGMMLALGAVWTVSWTGKVSNVR